MCFDSEIRLAFENWFDSERVVVQSCPDLNDVKWNLWYEVHIQYVTNVWTPYVFFRSTKQNLTLRNQIRLKIDDDDDGSYVLENESESDSKSLVASLELSEKEN